MMYIILLLYFVPIVTGDESSESKYIDLLPEKEKEDFLETVARRIFDNIKHKNAIPERDEHTKMIEKVLKEESLNLKRVSQNSSDNSDGKSNVVQEDGDALDLTREGKRNKRNSLKENNNSDIVRVQRTSKETNMANLNELSKELVLSDTEDIEVKHVDIKQTEVDNEEIITESNLAEIRNEITLTDLISKKNSSLRDDRDKQLEKNTIKLPPTTYKPEKIRDTDEEISESIKTTTTNELSYSSTDKIKATTKNKSSSEPFNNSSEKDAKQGPVAITVKLSLPYSPNVKLTDPASKEALKNNITEFAPNIIKNPSKPEEKHLNLANAITKIVNTSPVINVTETKTDKIETRKSYDTLDSNFNMGNISLDDKRDDNESNKAVFDDTTLTTKKVITTNDRLASNFDEGNNTDVKRDDNESTKVVIDDTKLKTQNAVIANDKITPNFNKGNKITFDDKRYDNEITKAVIDDSTLKTQKIVMATDKLASNFDKSNMTPNIKKNNNKSTKVEKDDTTLTTQKVVTSNDKLASNFDKSNITLDDKRDDNESTEVVIDDTSLTIQKVVTVNDKMAPNFIKGNNFTFDDNRYDNEITKAIIDDSTSTTKKVVMATDKLASNFDKNNITLDSKRDDNESTKVVFHDTSLTTPKVVTADDVKLGDYFDDESTTAAIYKKNNGSSSNASHTENNKMFTENVNNINSVTESGNKKPIYTIMNGRNNSNENIIKVMKNSYDIIKETTVNDYNGQTLENSINLMTKNTDVIITNKPEIMTTTLGSVAIKKKEITIENSKENTHNNSNRVTDVLKTEATMKNYKIKNGSEIVMTTSIDTPIDRHKEIYMVNNTEAVSKIYKNETEDKYEEVVTYTKDLNIQYDNSTRNTKNNRSVTRPDIDIAIENNERTTSETYIETTTVKIETLTVTTEINKSETNVKELETKADSKPYTNQDYISKTPIIKTIHESEKVISLIDMDENLEKMENISVNFVNDMIKVIRASFNVKPTDDLKTLRLLNENPKPKEYMVYKAPDAEPINQDYDDKNEKNIEENPYYVPVYNYGPEHAYYNPNNRLGPNADDDDVKIIKNAGKNVESIAHDYESIIKDDYNENDYQNRKDSIENYVRNDDDYDEAYNKEREFIDRMGDTRGNYVSTLNQNLRVRDPESSEKIKKVEYMKNLVKKYKNGKKYKNSKKKRSFGGYKLKLPVVVNYPKYSDIIMNSHDYLDVDYRYPQWSKPEYSRTAKHKILRSYEKKNLKDLIVTSFSDDPNFDKEDTVGDTEPYIDDKYTEDTNMFSVETQSLVKEKSYQMLEDDYGHDFKKIYQNHHGKPNGINLFDSEEYAWETQNTKSLKKKHDNTKSLGVKNQIRTIREMMYHSANFGFVKPKKVEENKNHKLTFINEVPKKCDGHDPTCVEPYQILKYNYHLYNRKQAYPGKHVMNNSVAYFISRTNNASDFVFNVSKQAARTNKKKTEPKKIVEFHIITWINDLSVVRDMRDKADCSFCNNSICYVCVCGLNYKFCKIPDITTDDADNNNNNDNNDVDWSWDTVKNISMLPSHLDPILKKNIDSNKEYLIFRSRDDTLPPKNNLRYDENSQENNETETLFPKPHIFNMIPQVELKYLENNPQEEELKKIVTEKHIQNEKSKMDYNKIKTLKSIMEIIPDDVELMLKVSDMLENQSMEEKEDDKGEKESLRSIESIDLESYVTVLDDMLRNNANGLIQYDWMGTSIDIQAAIYKLREIMNSVKNNEVLNDLDFKLLKYLTFLHKFSTKRQKDLRMFLPKPKYKYNRTRSQKGVYSRTWLKRRLKKFAFEVSGADLYYFMEFLEELQFYLYDLHTALTQIATVTSYKNQHWFKSLSELYLDNSRKNILELLLHFTTVRFLDLVENSVESGLQGGFLRHVINNEKQIEKSKDELVLILKIIEELKKS